MAAVSEGFLAGKLAASGVNGRLIATIGTSKTDSQIPTHRRKIYDELRQGEAVQMEFIEPGWYAGSLRRNRMAQLCDILIGISGGEGVEHLAQEFVAMGKHVIMLDLNLGSSSRDGSGGASRLFERALAAPNDFFRVENSASAQELLDRTRTKEGTEPAGKVVQAILKFVLALTAPEAFYVRLLNTSLPEFSSVETFFRNIVDSVVTELGYKPLQMGVGPNEYAWMNEAIFDSLHHSAVAIVDLTTLRPNCFMELGYALGRCQRVILTARDDTNFPFDAFALEAYLWSEADSIASRKKKLLAHWQRNIAMPAIVKPRKT
ncbi:MAG TPA: hypothetical protein VGL56_20870 [Fimbriimonadaceae bacterium]